MLPVRSDWVTSGPRARAAPASRAHPGNAPPPPLAATRSARLGHRRRQRLLEVAEQTLACDRSRPSAGGRVRSSRSVRPRERHELCPRGAPVTRLERLEERLAPEARGVHEGAVDVPRARGAPCPVGCRFVADRVIAVHGGLRKSGGRSGARRGGLPPRDRGGARRGPPTSLGRRRHGARCGAGSRLVARGLPTVQCRARLGAHERGRGWRWTPRSCAAPASAPAPWRW